MAEPGAPRYTPGHLMPKQGSSSDGGGGDDIGCFVTALLVYVFLRLTGIIEDNGGAWPFILDAGVVFVFTGLPLLVIAAYNRNWLIKIAFVAIAILLPIGVALIMVTIEPLIFNR